MTNVTVKIDETVKKEAETLFDKLGMSMSGAINIFVRQAIREQAIPFPIRAATAEEKYDEYFNSHNMKILTESIEQAKNGQVITKSLAESEAMEKGNLANYWSREIGEKNRLVYQILDGGRVEIYQCKGHYSDK